MGPSSHTDSLRTEKADPFPPASDQDRKRQEKFKHERGLGLLFPALKTEDGGHEPGMQEVSGNGQWQGHRFFPKASQKE